MEFNSCPKCSAKKKQVKFRKSPSTEIHVMMLFFAICKVGQYSAKSGYYFLKSEVRSSSPPRHQVTDQKKSMWKKIWQLAVPCKVRNFVWRVRQNAIPTKSNMVRRCIINDPTCPLCSQHHEDVLHSLWSCPGLP